VKCLISLVLALTLTPAFGQTCTTRESVHQDDLEKSRKWIELSKEQWYFVAGLYVQNPMTPMGLPFGDKAFLVLEKDSPGGIVVFNDGDTFCTPVLLPQQIVDMLHEVGVKINHVGEIQ
jgi:hypothetical protein